MILTLYKTLDGDNVINKTLTSPQTMTINLKRDSDIINLTLILAVVPGINFLDYNYCHISELDRFYFIRRVHSLSNAIFQLECECDVLETYKSIILDSHCQYQRQIGTGDYGPVDVDETGREIITDFESDVTLVQTNNAILSVMNWGK